jgi:tetratricopeptide (TPR) repeat protein
MKTWMVLVVVVMVATVFLSVVAAQAETYYAEVDGKLGATKLEGDLTKIQPDSWKAYAYGYWVYNGRSWEAPVFDSNGNCYFKTAAECSQAVQRDMKNSADDEAWNKKHGFTNYVSVQRWVYPIAVFYSWQKPKGSQPVGPAMKASLQNLYDQWHGWLDSYQNELLAYKTGLKWLTPEGRPALLNAIESIYGAYERVKKLKEIIDNDQTMKQLGDNLQAFVNETQASVNSAQTQYFNFIQANGGSINGNSINNSSPNPTPDPKPIVDARKLVAGGNFADAETAYRQIIATNPQNGQAMLELGALLLLNGKNEEAEQELKAAAKTLITNYIVHLLLAKVFNVQGKFDEAEKEAQVASNLAPPSNPRPSAMMGQIHKSREEAPPPKTETRTTPVDPQLQKQLDDALKQIESMDTGGDPEFARLKQILIKGLTAMKKGDDAEANRLLEEYLSEMQAWISKMQKSD